jgi:TIR domain.
MEDTSIDVFVSYASEDRETVARPLAEALQASGYRVWFDDFVLEVGDSLRREIDRGLSQCRYGVVILSPNFFAKQWPQKELDGLSARESAGQRKLILPVWHQLSDEDLRQYSPMLADRVGLKTTLGISHVVERIVAVLVSNKALLSNKAEGTTANVTKPQPLIHSFEQDMESPEAWWAVLLKSWLKDGCPGCGGELEYQGGPNSELLIICTGCGMDAVKELGM